MEMDWFNGCTTPEEIKSRYRSLAMEHHPDKGGDTRTMQDINAAYQYALNMVDGYTSFGEDGKEHTYRYDPDIEAEIMEKIDELIRLRMVGVEIWLVGLWVWLRGETRPHKEELKQAGCLWHAKRLCWYWKPEYFNKYRVRHSPASFEGLAEKYGASVFASKDSEVMAA